MSGTGSALMGIGTASGDNRAVDAAKQAVASPLLDISIEGAQGILFTITGGSSLGMLEVSEAAKVITSKAAPNAKVIFGATVDEELKDDVRVCVIATGFSGGDSAISAPKKKEEDYSPNSFLRKEQKQPVVTSVAEQPPAEEKEPVAKVRVEEKPVENPFVKKTLRSAVKEQPVMETVGSSDLEEDLEIPAFLRRKMSNQ
jgi:cell division protein FtsZ